jgi:hypothetical protein
MNLIAFRGATCWEAQIGPLWITVPYPRFLRVGCWPRIGWEREA